MGIAGADGFRCEGLGYVAPYLQGVVLCSLRVCTIGLGSLNHGIQSLMRVFGTRDPGLQAFRVQTSSVC